MVWSELRDQQWKEYTGDMLGLLVTALASIGGNKAKVPLYSEMTHPESKQKAPQQSNEDAVAHVYEIFGVKPPERG